MTSPDNPGPTTAFTVLQGLTPGQRVRVTWPNGVARVGLIGRTRLGPGEDYAILDGLLVGGEFETATSVEVMGSNGRYAPHWNAPPQP